MIKLLDILREIKVNDPTEPRFPLEVKKEDYNLLAKKLDKFGYIWVNGDRMPMINPFRIEPDGTEKIWLVIRNKPEKKLNYIITRPPQ